MCTLCGFVAASTRGEQRLFVAGLLTSRSTIHHLPISGGFDVCIFDTQWRGPRRIPTCFPVSHAETCTAKRTFVYRTVAHIAFVSKNKWNTKVQYLLGTPFVGSLDSSQEEGWTHDDSVILHHESMLMPFRNQGFDHLFHSLYSIIIDKFRSQWRHRWVPSRCISLRHPLKNLSSQEIMTCGL